jgi:CO/xanthine dehydrogenase FAD-binding subunit
MFIKRLPAFEYHAPASVSKALDLMAQYKNKGRFIAGGTDLLVAMKKREITPQHLISLNGIAALKGITPNKKGGVKIGALTTLAEIERSDIIQKQFLPLRDALNVMASAQVRSLQLIRHLRLSLSMHHFSSSGRKGSGVCPLKNFLPALRRRFARRTRF